jgi:hypothetical protein
VSIYLDAALAYAAAGHAVFPIKPGAKKPPLITNGLLSASKDPEQIRAWWAKWPEANIGMATGAVSGVTVIDVDTKSGKQGERSLKALTDTNGPLPEGPQQFTWSGGWQNFYLYEPGIKNSAGLLGPDLDIRGDGGYVVVPPSVVQEGDLPAGRYEWADGAGLDGLPLPRLPGWVTAILTRNVEALDAGAEPGWATRMLAEGSRAGERNQDAAKLVGLLVKNRFFSPELVEQIMEQWIEKSQYPSDPPGNLDKTRNQIREMIGRMYGKEKGEPIDTLLWGDPLPLPTELLPVPTFDIDTLLPPRTAAWVRDAAERMQCPPEYIAVPMIISLSSVIGRQCGIRPKVQDDWTVIPNLWGAIVGRPGTMKSPAMNEGLMPMNRLVADELAQWEAEATLREYNRLEREGERLELEKQIKGKKAAAGMAAYDRDGALAALEALNAAEAVTMRRFFTNDATVERIAMLHAENPNGLLVKRDELPGWLSTMDRDGHENDRAFYNEGWNGDGTYQQDRVGRAAVNLRGMCLSILGGIQPGPLKMHLTEVFGSGMTDDGLIQRFQLLVWPDMGGEWTNVDRYPDGDARERVIEVFRWAAALDPAALGAQSDGDVPYLRFSPDAQARFTRWRTSYEKWMRTATESAILISHFSKYKKLVPALALIFHLIDVASGDEPGPVSDQALKRALAWDRYLAEHARRVYQSVTDSAPNVAEVLAEKIESGSLTDGFKAWEIAKKGWSGIDPKGGDSLDEALKILVATNWIRKYQPPPGEKGGRPSVEYLINPVLLPSQ